MYQLTHLVSKKEQIDFLFAQHTFLKIAEDLLSSDQLHYHRILSIPTSSVMTICNYRTSAYELHKQLHEPMGENVMIPSYVFALVLRLTGDADLHEFQSYLMDAILRDKTLLELSPIEWETKAWLHPGWNERLRSFIERRCEFDVNEGILDQPSLLLELERADNFSDLCLVLLMTYDGSEVMDNALDFFSTMFEVFDKRFTFTFAAYENSEEDFSVAASVEKIEARYPLSEYLNRHQSKTVTVFNPARGGGFTCIN